MYVSGRCIQYYTKIQMDLCLDTELSMNNYLRFVLSLDPMRNNSVFPGLSFIFYCVIHADIFVQKVLCSEGPMFRRFYVQKVLCSEGSMFRGFYVQKVLYSEGSMFRRSYVQKYLFRRPYVQKVRVTISLSVPIGHTTFLRR